MKAHMLQIEQLDNRIAIYSGIRRETMPVSGWIKAIRTTLGMSMQQLGNRLNISRQGVLEMEKREKEGAITLNSLREIGNAMDLQLVYGFVPKDGSLAKLIERRATELAKEIVMRTAKTMELEDQSNSEKRIKKAIRERTESIIREMPKMIWD